VVSAAVRELCPWRHEPVQLTAQPEQDPSAIDRAKQHMRDRIRALLEHEGAAKPPGRVVGRIPNFLGAEATADQLAVLPAWRVAHMLKANPDKAQRPVRARALTEARSSTWRCHA
jgi:hypothetical protein